MKLLLRAAVAASALLIAISVSGSVSAQKRGGILKTYDPDSPERRNYAVAQELVDRTAVILDYRN
jgi:hypothetical protein